MIAKAKKILITRFVFPFEKYTALGSEVSDLDERIFYNLLLVFFAPTCSSDQSVYLKDPTAHLPDLLMKPA